MPMGKNVPQGKTASSYKFNLNTLAFFGDFNRVSVGQQFKDWTPKFKAVAGMTKPGSAPLKGSWWECEAVLPAAQFELQGPNRVGDQWRVMLAFNHMYHGWTQARIPAATSYFDPTGYPLATLVDKAPAVQMTMDELPGPMDGVAAAKFKVFNPTAAAVKLDVAAEYRVLAKGKKLEGSTELLKKQKIQAFFD